jgi:hypothetical protein
MTPVAFLAQLRESGFTVSVIDGRVKVSPASRLTDADRAAIRDHKGEFLALLAPAAPPASALPRRGAIVGPCPRCSQPSRIRCRNQGRPGQWISWCDSPECGRADVVDEAVIRRVEEAS